MTESKLYQNISNGELLNEYLKTRDNLLKQKLVLRYVYLVRMIAMNMRGVYMNFTELEDVVNEGIITLMNVIEKFDPNKNAEFETYASLRIRGTIIDMARKQDWLPRSARAAAKAIDEAESMLFNELGRHPSDSEMAEHLGVSIEKYLHMLRQTNMQNILSLDALINMSLEESGYGQIRDDDPNGMPEQVLSKNELKNKFKEAILTLRENEQLTISLYYRKDLSMREIAQVLGVKEPRVSQIHANAIRKLRIAMEKYISS